MRGGFRFSWEKTFNVQEEISSINPDIAKAPEKRTDVFTLSINKNIFLGGYDITLTVDLDKYPGLVPTDKGPYDGIPFKYKNYPFTMDFKPYSTRARTVDYTTVWDSNPEQSMGREDINIILNALVYFLFRKRDMSVPTEMEMKRHYKPGFSNPRRLFDDFTFNKGDNMTMINKLGLASDSNVKMSVLLGSYDTRMVSKLCILKQIKDNNTSDSADGKKCIVNMTLKYDKGTIQLVVKSYTGRVLQKNSLNTEKPSEDEKVITKMKTDDPNTFFTDLEAKLIELGKDEIGNEKEKCTFYQGATDFVMIPNMEYIYGTNEYFTFDEPKEIPTELESDKAKMEAFIETSLKTCEQQWSGKTEEALTNAVKTLSYDDRNKCIAFIDTAHIYRADSNKLGVVSRSTLQYIIDEHNKRLDADTTSAINKVKDILKKNDDERRKKAEDVYARI